MNSARNSSAENSHSIPENVKQLYSKYYQQVLNGCGDKDCKNENCASSGCAPKLDSNEAAAKALTLLRSQARLCIKDESKCAINNISKNRELLSHIKRQKSNDDGIFTDSSEKTSFGSSFMDIDESDKSPVITPRKCVDFLNETKLSQLIDDCKLGNDFAPLRRTLGQIFCNADSVNASFRLNEMAADENVEEVNVDVVSARKAFEYLFSIEELPFLHALINALTYLFENAELDLRYQRAYEKHPDFVNMFVLIMEMPILNEPQFAQNGFVCFCRAANRLPLDAQAILAKFWSKYSAERLTDMVRDVQQFITVKICTGAFVRNHYVQNDRGITSATGLLRILYYASLLGGDKDSDKVLTQEKELYMAADLELQTIFRQIDVNRSDHSSNSTSMSSTSFLRGTTAARDDQLGKVLDICSLDVKKSLVPYEEFYNETLCEYIQMDEDFKNFKVIEESDCQEMDENFSFMLYPFVLQPATKMQGLFYDNRIRMYSERRQALFQTFLSGTPSAPYLRLRVRRNHVVHDALALLEIITSDSPSDLKKQLFIEFENEQGVDEGGVSKEFYQLITEQLFNPDYGMFVCNSATGLYWFNGSCIDCDAEYALIGMLFGLAIYNNIIVDVQFPLVLHKKLMNKLGSFGDLKDFDPVLYKSLKSIMDYDKDDFEDVFSVTYRVSCKDVYGSDISHDLIHDGDKTNVTKENRHEFVELYSNYLLNQSIEQQFRAFRRGFLMVVNESPLFWLFRPDELEQLVCGSKSFDFGALEKSTQYDNGYSENHPVIKHFWEVVHEMSVEEKRRLLQFATGSDRIPVGGMAKLHFIIARNGTDSDKLPTAHTCFNVLLLPEYKTKEKLRERLLKAITYSKGFGLL